MTFGSKGLREIETLNPEAGSGCQLGLEIVAGRGFSDRLAADSAAIIVNEAAVRDFGWTEPLSKKDFFAEDNLPLGTVIGVVRDFNYSS